MSECVTWSCGDSDKVDEEVRQQRQRDIRGRENENLRVIIQKAGRQWLSIGTFGGNIIDVSRKDAAGAMLPDHLEEFVIGLNI